ncbi:triose-phosphate isomerase [Lampropedia puyangensis]|uniref:Triosephosphate isomerase n=1 Tax=Lampropedia puyangensis TaxID=1330072 RepID=A0A4S8FD85_9BURK|nr:triose-phosphate isomerase [Lampropedia puyangensis]THU05307.1 triose-phosphate isomerase [Lampropedia puyangensis]
MPRKLVVGNWKMNGSLAVNADLVSAVAAGLPCAGELPGQVDVAIAPPIVYVAQLRQLIDKKNSSLALAVQDVSAAASGAFTGDVAASMVAEFGVRYAIVGHSERRKYQGESDSLVAQKAVAAQQAGLTPIVCVGETLEERDAGRALAVVAAQVHAVLMQSELDVSRLVIAYEPVWAIGTGRTASPEQAQEIHAAIRHQLKQLSEAAANTAILYGGSMNAANAKQLLAQADIDGGLIGGAALKAQDFLAIVQAAQLCGE